MKHLTRISLFFALCLRAGAPAAAQLPEPPRAPDAWDAPRALELIGRAQQQRAESAADSGLANYQSDARVRVYFYLDREDTGERNLVKTDQLALDVFWQAPDQVKQRIVGWRDEKSLPTNIRYHLDHLSVVQENFGDEIRLGDGDEVRNVPHPASPGAENFYQFRLADSLILRLPGAPEPVAVYELQVRPRDPNTPGFVGAVFVERRRGDIVRMDFTFTGAAYVDRYLDYINISLENGLWEGRWWLPNQQRVEIRRQIPQLDIPAGSVIRANMQIGNYRFNQPLPDAMFAGPPVVAVPRAQREAFEFEEDLYAEVREEGLGPGVELSEIRRQAARLAREQALQRARGFALRLPNASDVLRFNRAEGVVLGAGVGVAPAPGLRLGAQAGYAFGAEHALGRLEASTRLGRGRLEVAGYANQPRDVGVGPAISGVINTLSSLFGSDYWDLYFASGASAAFAHPLGGGWTAAVTARVERQRSAGGMIEAPFGGSFRPLREIDPASPLVGGSVRLARALAAESGAGLGLALELEGGTLTDPDPAPPCPIIACPVQGDPYAGPYLKPQVEAEWRRRWAPREAALRVDARAGAAFGELPRQELYLIGGRGTVPGYDFRTYGGDRFATAQAVASAELARPWVRGRVLGALGWAGAGEGSDPALALWGARPTDGVLPSVGVGVGLFYDILRVDVARGLADGGRWELIVETRPSFWDFL